MTYNPAFKNLFQVIRKNLQLLYADEEAKKVFSPAPFVSFRSTRNLKSYLLRSKNYPLERKVGSEKCKSKRCLVCLNVSETDVFQSFQTKEQYKINHQLNCNDKCLIYLLSCKVSEIIGKPKEERNISSHLILSIFHLIVVLLLLTKPMGLIPLEERNTGEEY